MNQALIYGKDPLPGIVSVEPRGDSLLIFRQTEQGLVQEERPHFGWALAAEEYGSGWERLKGENHFKFLKRYSSHQRMKSDMSKTRDMWTCWDAKEAALIAHGLTYFKGLKLEDVPVLAFDIEATSLEHGPDAQVLLISNTFRRGRFVEHRLFSYDDYDDPADMFNDWCSWVRERDPSILAGHHIFGYDIPYLDYCARMAGTELRLGRDESPLFISDYSSHYRRDGSQGYEYRNAFIAGRELVDTFFLSFKYDVGRKYITYALKQIIEQEGLQVPGRQFYDAQKIRDNYKDPTEWAKIKAYAEHDADDALSLVDLMLPAFFYLAQSVPKTLQQIVNGATGSQINSLLVRGYLQAGHSIPKASESVEYEGAISLGNPGVYQNVFKVDVASLYPSIILEYGIEDRNKDPLGFFQEMMKHFTEQRLEHKRLGKFDRYNKDLSEAEKIVINSGYGFLGAPGLNFNSPSNAALVTQHGRSILQKAMRFALDAHYKIPNADTDSITASNGMAWTHERRAIFLQDLNQLFPKRIRWEDDGTFSSVLVVKTKNYVMQLESGKLITKGAALKATTKEPALREFLSRTIQLFLNGQQGALSELYHQYVREIHSIQDMRRWAFKRTVTETLFHSNRKNETKVLDAIEDADTQTGDKVFLFYDREDNLALVETWSNNHSVPRLLKKLYDTAQIFETVADTSVLPNYSLKRKNQPELKAFLACSNLTDTTLTSTL